MVNLFIVKRGLEESNMKSVMISIKPKYCELIAGGKKTIEVRKTKPKLNTPFKCYIYQTFDGRTNTVDILENNLGKVIGEFICDKITSFGFDTYYHTLTNRHDGYNVSLEEFSEQELYSKSCLSFADIYKYIGEHYGYGWHISNLVIYDKPKELSEFSKHDNTYDNALGWAFDNKLKSIKITKPPQSWCYVEGKVYCKDCKHLMFSDCYAECGKGYRGIVSVDDFCDKGELRWPIRNLLMRKL